MTEETETEKKEDDDFRKFIKPDQKFAVMALSDIIPDNDFNCRVDIDPSRASFVGFVGSIREQGLKETMTVMPSTKHPGKFDLVIGFRRYYALVLAGEKEAPVIIEHYAEPVQALLANLVENIQREKLSHFELGRAYSRLRKSGMRNKDVAKQLGVAPHEVSSLSGCFERLIPPFLEMFARHCDDMMLCEYKLYSTLSPAEQEEKYQEFLGRRERASAPDGEKPRAVRKKHMRKRMLINAFLGDVSRADSFRLRGKEILLSKEAAEIVRETVLWILGEVKRSPLVLPPTPPVEKKG